MHKLKIKITYRFVLIMKGRTDMLFCDDCIDLEFAATSTAITAWVFCDGAFAGSVETLTTMAAFDDIFIRCILLERAAFITCLDMIDLLAFVIDHVGKTCELC